MLQSIPASRSHIFYSQPGPEDHAGVNFDTAGHLTVEMLAKLGVPHDADFYVCGPPVFMQNLTTGLSAWGIPPDRVYTEVFGPGKSHMPGVIDVSSKPPHPPAGVPCRELFVLFAEILTV